jgi:hypothetical protein
MTGNATSKHAATDEDIIYEALIADDGFLQLTQHAPFRQEMRRIASVIARALEANDA